MNHHRALASILGLFLLALPASAAEVTPQNVATALRELDRIAEGTLRTTGVPGMSVVVVYKDRVVQAKGYGLREVGTTEKVDADTVFQLASLSKPLSSTVLAAVVGEGKLGWDDRIIDHDPGFRMYDPWVTREVTIRDMLCHRSGLPDHAGDHLEDIGYDRAQVLFRLRFEKPSSSFRSAYAYTNFGYTEAGVAGAMAAKTTWEDLAVAKLFQPLGMASTSYRFDDFAAARNRARSHVRIDGKWYAKYTREPDAQAPAGGASSTARDMGRWLRLQLAEGRFDGKAVVAAKALAETHLPQIAMPAPSAPGGRVSFYGLGWNVNYDAGPLRLSHSGAFALGVGTTVAMLPTEDIGIVVLTNGMPIGAAEAVAASFLDVAQSGKVERDWLTFLTPIFEKIMGPDYALKDGGKPPANPSPALALSAYTGTYASDYYGDIVIAEGKGGLELLLGPRRAAYALSHYDRDVFTYQPTGENAYGPSAVTFTVGPDGKAARVVIQNLDLNRQGTFTKRP